MRDARRLTATRAAADQSFRLVALPTDEACLPGQLLRACRSRRVGGRIVFCIHVELVGAAGAGDLIAHLTVLGVRALALSAAQSYKQELEHADTHDTVRFVSGHRVMSDHIKDQHTRPVT